MLNHKSAKDENAGKIFTKMFGGTTSNKVIYFL